MISQRTTPAHRRLVAITASVAVVLTLFGANGPGQPQPAAAYAFQVATDATTYTLCGRVFPDPHAYWPSLAQSAGRSPFAKGNAACAATDFLSYQQMVDGATYLESLFPQFVEFYRLEEDFGSGSDCATSVDSQDYCSAGLPRQGATPGRDKSDLYMLRVTDETVPDAGKKYFTFPLSIHGIERAGAEAGVRAAEDLATWAACEAGLAPVVVNCAKEGIIPHPLLETTPLVSVTAGEALAQSAIYFVFANPDGWRRGDPDNIARFYQRYNGNGVDMNRDWPTIGYTFEPYTPWSEPETRAFGQVMKGIRDTWDGGIDLHGQLIDRAFSFTLLGASERDYAKNQRILQTVRGAWADAENRLAWSPLIKPNDAPADDPRLYGVEWGTVWDTIDYTVTGSLGDWIDSPLGLGADGIDNEMSLSHLSNCGLGSCYLPDPEQLHVDGNKSLIYSMVNFTLQPEDTTFNAPGRIGYVVNPTVLTDGGGTTPPPTEGLPPQGPITNVSLDPTNSFTYEFEIRGPSQGFYNGGVEGKATPVSVSAISGSSALTSLVLERYRPDEPEPIEDDGCNLDDANWEEVNTYFNQSPIYLQAGQAVHGNLPSPGRWRICLTGGLASHIAANGGYVDLDISFSTEQAWEDPGQVPYAVTNMQFFRDLAANVAPGELVPVAVDDILSGAVDLDAFTSLVVADDPFPGYSEPLPTGPAQPGNSYPNPGVGTAPCAYSEGTQPVLPPTCVNDFEFDVSADFNNQQLTATLTTANAELNDWDLYAERQSVTTGEWSQVGKSTTATGNEQVTLLSPLVGHYRVRVVNWSAVDPSSAQSLVIAFSNEYAGPPRPPSARSDAERDAWAAALGAYASGGGNLVLTDGAIKNAAYMGLVPRTVVNTFSVYAGYIGFTVDGGTTDTYGDPLAANVDQPGAAEGTGHRHQTYEPVPIGFAIQNPDGADFNASPVWSVDQTAWQTAGGRTAGTTTADQVTLGELAVGRGVVRIIGAVLPMPTEQYYHPFGLANYAVTYSGYQVLNNALQWQRPLEPDLVVTAMRASNSRTREGQKVTVFATVANPGPLAAGPSQTEFRLDDGTLIGTAATANLAAGASVEVSVNWDTRSVSGQHRITATADIGNVVDESNERNNSGTLTVTVRGNKVQNGSFEQSSADGSGPEAWEGSSTGAGSTGYSASGGTEGSSAVTVTGTGASVALAGMPTWTSAPIDVVPGETLSLRVSVSSTDLSSAPGVGLAYLGPAGELLNTVRLIELPLSTAGFTTLDRVVTIPAGVVQVRVVLFGFAASDLATAGTVVFDDVGLFEE